MARIKRGGFIFISWIGDHTPRHVHVYRDRVLVVKWDLENGVAMVGTASARILRLIAQLGGGGVAMKIRSVSANNRRKVFEVRLGSRVLPYPYSRTEPQPSASDPVREIIIDPEVGREAFWYVVRSGARGYVHAEQVLDYNQDPSHMRDQLLYRLTLEAQRRVKSSPLSTREIIRRLGTSATQFYRLLDQTNYRKSLDQLLSLLQVLDCDVEVVLRDRGAA